MKNWINFFLNLDCTAKINIAAVFVLPIIKTRKYSYFYAQENKTLFNENYFALSSDSDLIEKRRKDMTGSTSIVFTSKAVPNETLIRKSKNFS